MRMGDLDRAEVEFQGAKAMAPDNQEIEKGLEELSHLKQGRGK